MKRFFLAVSLAAGLAFSLGQPPAFAAGEGHEHGKEPKAHDSEFGEPGDPKKVTRAIEVDMGDDMRFKPANIEVRKGETIKFVVKNNGALRHEMVLGTRKELEEHAAMMRKHPGMEHEEPNGVYVEPGRTGTLIWRFSKSGIFDFACLEPGHFEAGMVGKITVSR